MKTYPKPGTTLPELGSRPKPQYRGLVARFVGLFVWLFGWTDWAKDFNTEYHTTIRGTVYSPVGKELGASLWLHERVHGWQEQQLGVLRYYWRYLLRSRAGRFELEAQAYSSEVVAGYRSMSNAVSSLIGHTYYPEPWFTPTESQGQEAIDRHVAGWKAAGHGRDTVRKLSG